MPCRSCSKPTACDDRCQAAEVESRARAAYERIYRGLSTPTPMEAFRAGFIAGQSEKCAHGVAEGEAPILLADARRLRELLRRTQTYVCSNRELEGADALCGEIAEALAATKHMRPAGVTGTPSDDPWADALDHAAVYVENHCVDGEDHAKAIRELARPAGAWVSVGTLSVIGPADYLVVTDEASMPQPGEYKLFAHGVDLPDGAKHG